jgi:hypothetical protein
MIRRHSRGRTWRTRCAEPVGRQSWSPAADVAALAGRLSLGLDELALEDQPKSARKTLPDGSP